MPNIRGPELLILVLVIVLLFGAKRLPDAARSVGRSLRIFKAETKGLTDSDESQSQSQPQSLPGSATGQSGDGTPSSEAQTPHTTPPAPPAPPSQA
jgi:sec-independent protein translocase protein TatA